MADSTVTGNVALVRLAMRAGLLPAPAAQQVDPKVMDAANSAGVIEWIVLKGGATEHQLAEALAATCRLRFVDLTTVAPAQAAAAVVSEQLATRHQIVPVELEGATLVVATANPLDQVALRAIEFATGKRVRPLVATLTAVRDALAHVYHGDEALSHYLKGVPTDAAVTEAAADAVVDVRRTRDEANAQPVVRLLNQLLVEGLRVRASDIHIEPATSDILVRYRVNGVLEESLRLPKWVQDALISRCKVVAGLDITERRVPQDGRIHIRHGDALVDLRLSILPTQFGEKITMRILDPSAAPQNLDQLMLPEAAVEAMRHAMHRPEGLILATGPTGSGKTTTLYGILNELRSPTRNIVTIENPIEYQLAGINQVEINNKQGRTFAATLRAILRQDPDVILVGEIRDAETAEIALQAAQTGHLVLSTLHTNDSVATITRLLDLGIEPYILASSLHLVVAQRLVRRLCKKCAQPYTPDPGAVRSLPLDPRRTRFLQSVGCAECRRSGWAGRAGVYEVLRVTPTIGQLIATRATESTLRREAETQGMLTLAKHAALRVADGVTTIDEVLRAVDVGESSACCPACQQPIDQTFAACPHCGEVLRRCCVKCEAPMQAEWKLCPYCRTPVPELSTAAAPTPQAAGRPLRSAPGADAARRSYRVLVVDDHADMRNLAKISLELSGLPLVVDTACDGYEALRKTEQEPPDVIVLDLTMPGLDGFQVCEQLRASIRTAFIPIMMLTARDDAASRVKGFLVGTDDYVMKPFARDELVARLRRLLERTYGITIPRRHTASEAPALPSGIPHESVLQ